MTDRYQPMTLAESAELARQSETQDAVSRMGTCIHNGACIRAVGQLCFKEDGYGEGWGLEAQKARENAARWLRCMDCYEWSD